MAKYSQVSNGSFSSTSKTIANHKRKMYNVNFNVIVFAKAPVQNSSSEGLSSATIRRPLSLRCSFETMRRVGAGHMVARVVGP